MSKADEDHLLSEAPENSRVDKAEFEKLNAEFNLKKIITEIIIKKENFVFNKESDVKQDYEFIKELG